MSTPQLAGPPISPDGHYWWDGQAWQPMPAAAPAPAPAPPVAVEAPPSWLAAPPQAAAPAPSAAAVVAYEPTPSPAASLQGRSDRAQQGDDRRGHRDHEQPARHPGLHRTSRPAVQRRLDRDGARRLAGDRRLQREQ